MLSKEKCSSHCKVPNQKIVKSYHTHVGSNIFISEHFPAFATSTATTTRPPRDTNTSTADLTPHLAQQRTMANRFDNYQSRGPPSKRGRMDGAGSWSNNYGYGGVNGGGGGGGGGENELKL